LRALDEVYPCACTRRELEATAPVVSGERVYPGTCRHGVPPALQQRGSRAWRLRIDRMDSPRITVHDRLQGALTQNLAIEVGDFVLRRADGLFAYQLAVVVDDAAQQVTHIVRGADLATSTPRQVCLQQRLGLPTPSYLHVPVAIDSRGQKLSKQTRAPALPAEPLPLLWQAWSFLGQALPERAATPASAREFWSYANACWNPARLPPVAMLPAPRAAGSTAARAL
jgi:glutamyl-Q tRNA(Asp) synthetase